MLDGEMKWKVLAPMPKPNSHIESSWILWNNSIIITGGSTEKHPVTKRIILVGEVFRFHLDTLVCILLIFYITFFHSISILLLLDNLQTWSVVGKLPYRVKTTMTGFWDGCFILHQARETGDQTIHNLEKSSDKCGEPG